MFFERQVVFSGNGTVSVARLKPQISTVPTLVSRAMEIGSRIFFRALGTWIERHGFRNDPENRHFNEYDQWRDYLRAIKCLYRAAGGV